MTPDLLAAAIEWRECQRSLPDDPSIDQILAWDAADKRARTRLIAAIDAYTARTQAAVDALTGGAA
jgi:hypothetical protein